MPKSTDMQQLLRGFDILEHFSDDQIETLAGCVSRVRYPAGVRVLEEGESTVEAYLIADGELRIQRDTPYGVYPLATLGAGALFGEASFLDRKPRSGDAVALADTTLVPLNPVAMESAMEADRRFAIALHWAFWKSISEKLRATNDRLAQFFQETGTAPEPTPPPEPDEEPFKVGIDAKRELFEEQKLSPLEIRFLSSLSRELRVDPGEILFREGEEGDQMYVVLDGRVMISRVVHGAGEEALAFLGRGDYFGEMALIDQKPRTANAKAAEDGAVVLAISRKVIERILDINKMSSLRLLRILSLLVAERLREIDEKLVSWYIFSGGSGQSLEAPSV